MFGFIRTLIADLSRRSARAKSPQRQVEEYLETVRHAFHTELASHLAAALLARKTLDTTRQVDVPFPSDYFDGTNQVDDAARVLLNAYEQKLWDFREELVRHNSLFSTGVAKGVGIWIVSIHTLTHPDLVPKGFELWGRLRRGDDYLDEAYRLIVRREITDIERTYLNYRPAVFTPKGVT